MAYIIKNQIKFLLMLTVCLVFINNAHAQTGGTYDLTWSTIDGGGGRSSGGAYVVEGTIGQPDTGLMSGGSYILSGGFWPGTTFCIVDLPDLANFTAQWLVSVGSPEADFNDSGSVDLFDFNYLANYWLRLCPDTWPWW